MSLDHWVEVLFLPVIALAQYVVDGTNATGKASLRRSADLSERFRVITQDIRTFHAHTARVAASRQFRLTLVTCSNGDLQ